MIGAGTTRSTDTAAKSVVRRETTRGVAQVGAV